MAGLALSGCGSAERLGSAADRSQRARLSLEQIEPPPALPPPAAAESPLTGPAQDQLDAARAALRHEQWTEVLAAAQKGLRLQPDSAALHVLAARGAFGQSNIALARAHLEKAIALNPRNDRAYLLDGLIARRERDTAQARRQLHLALRCAQANSGAADAVATQALAHLYLALVLSQDGYRSAALAQIESFSALLAQRGDQIRADPDARAALAEHAARLPILTAELHQQLGRPDRAVEVLARAAADDPQNGELRARWAAALAATKKTDEAFLQAERAAAALGDDAAIELFEEVCRLAGVEGGADERLMRLALQPGRPSLTLRLAERWRQAGRFDAAATMLARAAAQDTANPQWGFALCEVLFAAGRWDEAIGRLAEWLTLDPRGYHRAMRLLESAATDPAARRAMLATASGGAPPARARAASLLRARLLRLDGKADEADVALERALAAARAATSGLDAFAAPLCVELAASRLAGSRWREAAELCREALRAGYEDAELHVTLGDALEAADELVEAEAAYRSAARLSARDATPLLRLAALQLRRGEGLRAVQTYQQIVADVDPRCVEAREALIRAALSEGKADRAVHQIEDMRRLGLTGPAVDRCKLLVSLASSSAAGSERLEKYRAGLAEIISRHPDDAASYVDRAFSFMTERRHAEALDALDALLARDPQNLQARELKVTLLRKLLRHDEAEALLAAMAAERPQRRSWRVLRADVALDRVDDERAMAELRGLIEAEPNPDQRWVYQQALLDLLSASGRHDQAVALAQSIVAGKSSNDDARLALIAVLNAADRRDEATEAASRFLREEPSRFEWRQLYARQLAGTGGVTSAALKVLGWLEDAPEDLRLTWLLAEVYLAGRDYRQVIAVARGLGFDQPRVGPLGTFAETAIQQRTLVTLLEAFEQTGQTDAAVEFVQSLAQARADPDLDALLVNVYLRGGKLDDAARLLNRLLAPQLERKRAGLAYDAAATAGWLQMLALVHQRQGEPQRAEAVLSEVLAMNPDDPGVNNDLGYTWADAGRNLDRAYDMVRLAVSEEPRNEAYLDSLGWVYYKRGEFEQAAEWLRRAARWSRGKDPVILDHSGDAAFRLGQKAQAEAAWRQAVATARSAHRRTLDPGQDARVLERAEAKLAALAAGRAPPVADLGIHADPSPASAPATGRGESSPAARGGSAG